MSKKISANQHILTDLRLRKFTAAVNKLLPKILAEAIRVKSVDPLGEHIISFCDEVQTNLDNLFAKIKTINEDIEESIAKRIHQEDSPSTDKQSPSQNQTQRIARYCTEAKSMRLQAVSYLASTLRKLERIAADILIKIKSIPSSATGPDTSIAEVNDIGPEFLELIKQSLPSAVTGMIGRLSRENHDPVRVLFVGPPGNGKTTVAQVIAQVCKRPFLFIRTASLGNSYQFSRENQLEALITYIEKNQNAVILFDEIDALAEYTHLPQRAAEELQSIIDLATKKYPKVIFIGTTNYKDKIPAPLLSRFAQNTIEIPNPSAEQRVKIIQYHIKRLQINGIQFYLTQDYLQSLCTKTKHFSIRDLESLLENVQGQANEQVGQHILQSTCQPTTSESDVPCPFVITKINMEKAYQEVLKTIVQPESLTSRILATAVKVAPVLPYINQATSIASLGLSIYGTIKAEQNRKEEHKYQEDQRENEAVRIAGLERARERVQACIRGHSAELPRIFYVNGNYHALTKKELVDLLFEPYQKLIDTIKQNPNCKPEELDILKTKALQQADQLLGK